MTSRSEQDVSATSYQTSMRRSTKSNQVDHPFQHRQQIAVAVFLSLAASVHGFGNLHSSTRAGMIRIRPTVSTAWKVKEHDSKKYYYSPENRHGIPAKGKQAKLPMTDLSAAQDSGDQDKEMPLAQGMTTNDSFDGQGFANYLAPYALAVIASIVVTGLFIKFVLLDY